MSITTVPKHPAKQMAYNSAGRFIGDILFDPASKQWEFWPTRHYGGISAEIARGVGEVLDRLNRDWKGVS